MGDISATFTGTAKADGSNLSLSFQFGTTTNYGSTATATPSSHAGTSSIQVAGSTSKLKGSTLYHYRLRATDSAGNSFYGEDATFTTAAPTTPIEVRGMSGVSEFHPTEVELFVSELYSGGGVAQVWFEYGLTSAYGNSTYSYSVPANTLNNPIYIDVEGLVPETTYHFRYRAESAAGTVYGPDQVLTTPAAPTATALPAVEIGDLTALLRGMVDPKGRKVAVVFEYGVAPNFSFTGNAVPTTVSGATPVEVNLSRTALRPDALYQYRLRLTDSETQAVHWSNTLTFRTAPPIQPPSVGSASVTSIRTTTAEVTVSSATAGASQASLVLDYGKDGDYGLVATAGQVIPAASGVTKPTFTLTNLEPGTTYHLRPRAFSAVGTALGENLTFTTSVSPVISTEAATGVTGTAATLRGVINPNGANFSISFEYGTSDSYGLTLSGSSLFPGSVSGTTPRTVTASVSSLVPETTYHFRFKAWDGKTSYYGADQTFTTGPDATVPVVQSGGFEKVTATTAIINASNIATGGLKATVIVEYGQTTDYGSVVETLLPPDWSQTGLKVPIRGLEPGTVYHYRVRIVTSAGSSAGIDRSFTTLPLAAVTTQAATNITGTQSRFNAAVNAGGVPSTLGFEYGTTPAYGMKAGAIAESGTTLVNLSQVVTGLNPGITYYCRARLENTDGVFYGESVTFTTAGTPLMPTGKPVVSPPVSITGITLQSVNIVMGSVGAGGSVTRLFFDYGETTGYGSTMEYPFTIPAGGSRSPDFAVSGLNPGTTYHGRLRASNEEGETLGVDFVFTTGTEGSLSTGSASKIARDSALLEGTIDPEGSGFSLSFSYWTEEKSSVRSIRATPIGTSGSGIWQIQCQLVDLFPDTTYFYRLVGTREDGSFLLGEVMSFRTQTGGNEPRIVTGATGIMKPDEVTVYAIVDEVAGFPHMVFIEYGTTPEFGLLTQGAPVPEGTKPVGLPYVLKNLEPETTYYYRAKLVTPQGEFHGVPMLFTTFPNALKAVTLPADRVSNTKARLNGMVGSNQGRGSIYFDFGTDRSYGTRVAGTPSVYGQGSQFSSDVDAVAQLEGLLPGTTYHYRIVNIGSHSTLFGEDLTFKTPAQGDPVIVEDLTTTASDGTIHFRALLSGSDPPASVVFEYGTNAKYNMAIRATHMGMVDGNGDYRVSVSGFSSGSTCYYRIVASNPSSTTWGKPLSVRVVGIPVIPPVTGLTTTDTTMTLAISSGELFYCEYGTTPEYGSRVGSAPFYGCFLGSHPNPPLLPNTTYHYRLVFPFSGGTVHTEDRTFTTDHPKATVDSIGVSDVTATAATLKARIGEAGGSDTLLFSYWETGAPQTNVPGNPSVATTEGFTNSELRLTGLRPGTTYFYDLSLSRLAQMGSLNKTYIRNDTFRFRTLTLAEEWRQRHFQTTSDSGDAADLAIPRGDGIPNLIKYALGMDPTLPASPLPMIEDAEYDGSAHLRYRFTRDPAKNDITYTVEAADSPAGPWSGIATSVKGRVTAGPGFVSETAAAGGLRIVEVRDPVSIPSAPHRFLRLRITR